MTTPTTEDRTGPTTMQLQRLAGLALIAALPLQVIGFLVHPPSEELRHVVQGTYGPAHLILFLSWVLVLLGLPVLYAVQAHRAGRLGLIAFVGTMGATAYHLYLTLYEASVIPVVATQPAAETLVGGDGALSHGAGALGPLAVVLLLAFPLLGTATLRAGVLPRIVGWLQIACLPAFLALMLVIGAVNGGEVGPEATNWIGGMLPIASLYWVLFTGYALGGRAVRTGAVPQVATAQPASGILHRS
ncbi:MAG: hypothetical protein M4D85_00465 [Actinomycetota bacterium]|nr:hypothetical protein [Actinomycetota bacterium]